MENQTMDERHRREQGPSIGSQLEKIAEEMCSNYCKWPSLWDEEKEGYQLSESYICMNCPMGRLT